MEVGGKLPKFLPEVNKRSSKLSPDKCRRVNSYHVSCTARGAQQGDVRKSPETWPPCKVSSAHLPHSLHKHTEPVSGCVCLCVYVWWGGANPNMWCCVQAHSEGDRLQLCESKFYLNSKLSRMLLQECPATVLTPLRIPAIDFQFSLLIVYWSAKS